MNPLQLARRAASAVWVNPNGVRSEDVAAFCQAHDATEDTGRRVAALVRMGYSLESGVLGSVLERHAESAQRASADPLSSTPRRAAAIASAAAAGDSVQRVLTNVVPTARVQELKLALFDVVRQRVAMIAPGARAAVFGSVAAQTDTTVSDIDITVCGDVDDPHLMLKALYHDLCRLQWKLFGPFNRCLFSFVDTARVPTIRAEIGVPRAPNPEEDTTREIFFDVSFNQLSGLRHSAWLRLIVIPDTPLVAPMLRLVKHWLVEHGLPDAKHGGFGSFFWSVLVVRCCRQIAAACAASPHATLADIAATAVTPAAALRAMTSSAPPLDVAMEIFFKMYAQRGAFAWPLPSESGPDASALARSLRRPVSENEFAGVWAKWPAVVNPMTGECVSFRMSSATWLLMRLELQLAATSLTTALRSATEAEAKAEAKTRSGDERESSSDDGEDSPKKSSSSSSSGSSSGDGAGTITSPFLIFLQYGQLLLARVPGTSARKLKQRFGQAGLRRNDNDSVLIAELWYLSDKSKRRGAEKKSTARAAAAGGGAGGGGAAATPNVSSDHVATWSGGSLSFRPSHFVCLLQLHREQVVRVTKKKKKNKQQQQQQGKKQATKQNLKESASRSATWVLSGDELRRYKRIGLLLRDDEEHDAASAREAFDDSAYAPWIATVVRRRALVASNFSASEGVDAAEGAVEGAAAQSKVSKFSAARARLEGAAFEAAANAADGHLALMCAARLAAAAAAAAVEAASNSAGAATIAALGAVHTESARQHAMHIASVAAAQEKQVVAAAAEAEAAAALMIKSTETKTAPTPLVPRPAGLPPSPTAAEGKALSFAAKRDRDARLCRGGAPEANEWKVSAPLRRKGRENSHSQQQPQPRQLTAMLLEAERPRIARGSSYDVLGEDEDEDEEDEEEWPMAADMQAAPPSAAASVAKAAARKKASSKSVSSTASKRGGKKGKRPRAYSSSRPSSPTDDTLSMSTFKVDVAQVYTADSAVPRKELMVALNASERRWNVVEINADRGPLLSCGISGVRGDVSAFNAVLSCCMEGAPHAFLNVEKEMLIAEAKALRRDKGGAGGGNAAASFGALEEKVVENCVRIGTHEMLARAVLAGLGFCAHDQEQPTRMLEEELLRRLELARALVGATGAECIAREQTHPSLIFLHAPETFLDLRSKVWLERYVPNHTLGGAVVMLSGRFSPFVHAVTGEFKSSLKTIVKLSLRPSAGSSPEFMRSRSVIAAAAAAASESSGSADGTGIGAGTNAMTDMLSAAAATKLPTSPTSSASKPKKQAFSCGVIVGSYGSGKSKMLHKMTRLKRSRSPSSPLADRGGGQSPTLPLLFSRANAESLGKKLPPSTTVAQWLALRNATLSSWMMTSSHLGFDQHVCDLTLEGKARLLLAYIFSHVDRRELAWSKALAERARGGSAGAAAGSDEPYADDVTTGGSSPLPSTTEEHVIGFDEPLRVFDWSSERLSRATTEELTRRLSQLFQRSHTLCLKVVVVTHNGFLAKVLSDETSHAQVWAKERGSNKISKLSSFFREFPAYVERRLKTQRDEYGADIEARMHAYIQRVREENDYGSDMNMQD